MTRGNPIVAQFLATVPEILWEASLGVYLTVKGFKRSSPLIDATRRVPAPAFAPAVA